MATSSLLQRSTLSSAVILDKEQLLGFNPTHSSMDIVSSFKSNLSEENILNSNDDHIESAGYTSDDESSDNEEPQDSGRTRSSTRRTKQLDSKDTEEAPVRVTRSAEKSGQSNEGRGKKRKKTGAGGDGSDSESEDNQGKRRQCTEPVVVGEPDEVVCICPKDVMTCIGILPCHPIISYFHDSDDSDSSCNDDLTHTVLPSVNRNRHESREG